MRIIVPAPPGGITDIGGRIVAAQLQATWGQAVVVENRSGGGGVTGTVEFLRAPADGHTLLVGNIGPQAIAYTLFRGLPYEASAFAPVSGLIRGPNILVVHPSVEATTVADFIALLRRRPRELNYASSGIGQSPHLAGVWFLQLAQAEATHVPFRGSAPALVELLAGNVQFMFVPALRETAAELAGYDVSTWVGLFAHASAPAEAIAAINAEVRAVLGTPDTALRFAQAGSIPHVTTPEQFTEFVGREVTKWRDVIRREGLVMELS